MKVRLMTGNPAAIVSRGLTRTDLSDCDALVVLQTGLPRDSDDLIALEQWLADALTHWACIESDDTIVVEPGAMN